MQNSFKNLSIEIFKEYLWNLFTYKVLNQKTFIILWLLEYLCKMLALTPKEYTNNREHVCIYMNKYKYFHLNHMIIINA